MNERRLFWACFIALIATAFGFSVRGTLTEVWGLQFGLSATQIGEINGAGLWPFAISIVLFSLLIDRIGYGKAMAFAFFCHVLYVVIVCAAPTIAGVAMPGAAGGAAVAAESEGRGTGYWLLYLGNFIFALGNGTVEAVINPVVATLFSREKTKWLNILHAGWPGGLVLAGLLVIGMAEVHDWRLKVALVLLPALIYGPMMLTCKFPVSERVAAGVSYNDMLKEFGFFGALIVATLIVFQLVSVLEQTTALGQQSESIRLVIKIGLGLAIAGAFGAYTKSPGRALFIALLLIMIPLATTELGTDSWITDLMKPVMTTSGLNAGWVLVYTSAIMMVLRFFAGPIVHKLSPLGLLATCSLVAAGGLMLLSGAEEGKWILLAATVYGFGKSFFWPTMLGVVSEQFPKGGALTLNSTGGVGMLGVGVVGAVFIGWLQGTAVSKELKLSRPAIAAKVVQSETSIFGTSESVNPKAVQALPESDQKEVSQLENKAKQRALFTMAIFPTFMFLCYMGLIFYFRSQGGYKAEVLTGHAAEDRKFTGGVQGPVEA